MARFENRHFELIDIIDQFEAQPSSTHYRNALGAIHRLKDDGRGFWEDGSKQLRRWQGYCDDLLDFLSFLGTTPQHSRASVRDRYEGVHSGV